jgi:hypothetical protein
MRVDRIGGACAVLLATAVGCTKDATQLIVVVDSDLLVPEELEAVRAAVADAPGAPPRDTQDFPLFADPLPFSFGVVPNEDGDAEVLIALAAIGPRGSMLFEERAVTEFVEEKTLRLRMDLRASCVADPGPCEEPERIDPSSLDEVEPGDELDGHMKLRPRNDAGVQGDAGSSDSGVMPADAGAMDAEPMDAAPDAGAMDAAPMDAAPMDAAPGEIDPSCTTTTDCDQPNKCPPDALDCVCRQTPQGMNCVPTCTANDPCPQPPDGPMLRCDLNMGLCVPA